MLQGQCDHCGAKCIATKNVGAYPTLIRSYHVPWVYELPDLATSTSSLASLL